MFFWLLWMWGGEHVNRYLQSEEITCITLFENEEGRWINLFPKQWGHVH